ncbi:MAG: hypothetical protein AAGA77_04800 [Bacteroidota bacterium]
MKKVTTLLALAFFISICSYAQSSEDEGFSRKGKFLVETGYNIVGGLSNSTGANIQLSLDGDGGSITAIGTDIGKMLTDNLALKFKLGLLSANGLDITNITGGVKYYAGGNVPIELTAGIIDSAFGSTQFNANLKFGYAINLADNITLEPSMGAILIYDESALNFGVSFAMFL